MPNIRTLLRCLVAAILMTTAVAAGSLPAGAVPGLTSTVFINELHYDNVSTDTGEFIEVAGLAGTDLAGWTLVLYNGSNGTAYNTIALSGVLADQSGGYGFHVVTFPSNGIQNGSPDGVALVNDGTLVQFLSYEGTLTATNGPANGLTSTDIGVDEPSSTPVGFSLALTGTGTTAGEFAWAGPAASTPGTVNDGQVFSGVAVPARVVINEIDYDQPGGDTAEFVELYNGGGSDADLTGWELRLVNGANNGAAIYDTIALSGALAPGDYLVVCANAATVANCDIDDGPDTNFIQNGAPDGVLLLNGSAAVVDGVSYEGSVPGVVEGSGFGLEDSGADANRSISRLPDGTDSNQNNVDLALSCTTSGEANVDAETGCGESTPRFIHEVQGNGDSSPFVGDLVTIEGVVVGDYEGDASLRGFYVQEEDGDADVDPSTSEGIFVFHGNVDSVDLGDVVSVTGPVAEFQDQTQLGFPSDVTVNSSGNAVTAATITMPFTSAADLEAVEGMLVVAPQTLYVTEFFQLGRFGQIVVSSGDRLDQPTTVAEPGPAAQAIQAANDLNRLIIDDDNNNQNPEPIVFGRNGDPLSATNTLRGGDTVTGTVGVMTYTWAGNNASGNAYRLRPVGDLSDSGLVDGGGVPNFQAANPRPSGPPAVGGSVQVASFNVLNYFPTIDFSNICGPTQDQDCRGADDDEEFERQETKLLEALVKLDVDVIGLVEVENTPGVDPEADLAAGMNGKLGGSDWASVDAASVGGGVVGTDTIRVGVIYDSSVVAPVGAPALLDFSPDSLGEDRSRTAVAQTFVELSSGEVFTVVVNHLKSKGSSGLDCSDPTLSADCDQGDGAANFNDTRATHAAELVAWLSGDPTGSGDADVLIMGDLNSYAEEDPIDVLRNAGYVDVAPESYSYAFDGQWGSLDYIFASPSIITAVTGAGHYHINADEPPVLDYNTGFQSPGQVESLYAPDEFRTSDHDPALVGLALNSAEAFDVTPSPDELWSPNHKYQTVTVSASGPDGAVMVEILSADSSEADSGFNGGDKPNDIGTIDGDTVELRAERFSKDGRIYTVYVRISDGTQTLFTSTEVVVPHSQGKKK